MKPLELPTLWIDREYVRVWRDVLITDPYAPRTEQDPTNRRAPTPNLVLASFCGYGQDILRMGRAIKRHDHMTSINGRTVRVVETKGRFLTFQTSLTLRQTHGMLVNTLSTLEGIRESSIAYLVTPAALDRSTPAPQFFSFLDQLTSVPLHHQWTTWLWTQALDEGWLLECDGTTEHCHAWRLEPDEVQLTSAIQHALTTGILDTPYESHRHPAHASKARRKRQ